MLTGVSWMTVSASVNGEQRTQKRALTEGGKLRCPNCGELRYPQWYRVFDRPDEFKRELNVIYQCTTARGGCGHAFSPGDPDIIESYLSGRMVPVEAIPDLIYAALGHDPRPRQADSNADTEVANG